MSVIWLRQVNWRQMKPRTFFWVLFGLILSGPLAAFVSIVVLGLLSYSFVISIGLPGAQRAAPLATIATGIALFTVAALAYLLQRRGLELQDRSLELQDQSFDALHEPSLGIHYKNPTMYPSTEVRTGEATKVYAEYIMWNAGDVPILIWQPAIVPIRGLGPVDLGKGITQLERVRGNKLILEQSFPIVLGKGEVCTWRQFTSDTAPPRPIMAEKHDDNRERVEKFLRDQKGNRHFLFAVRYFSKPPATLRQSDMRTQFVGLAYQAPDGDSKEGAK